MKTKEFGIFITLLGGILWGFSGACGQFLFEFKGISSDWLVPYRLLGAGFGLVAFHFFKSPKICFSLFSNVQNLVPLTFYAICGLTLTQYFYFYSIELSNAAVSTAIQYIAPAIILLVVCMLEKRLPRIRELIALLLAVSGVFLLVINGEFGSLAISHKALIFALLSAVCVAVYNLGGKKLMEKYPISLVLGWGMLLGGFVLGSYLCVWEIRGVSDLEGFLAYFGVVFFGTILAFSFYMLGVKLIGATKASLIAAVEPASAAVFAYFWLGTNISKFDVLGATMIIACVFLLAKGKK